MMNTSMYLSNECRELKDTISKLYKQHEYFIIKARAYSIKALIVYERHSFLIQEKLKNLMNICISSQL